jgi:redox-sensitive bicupin YhaK (pirin superfamily)
VQLSVKSEADQNLLNKLKEIESHVIEAAFENSMSWLKKKFTSSTIVGELFSSSIQYPKDKDTGEITNRYPPTIKFQIAKDCEAYLASTKEKITVSKETITKGAHVAVIARMSAIWFVGNKFGIVCKAEQLKVSQPTSSKEYGFMFDEDDVEGNI